MLPLVYLWHYKHMCSGLNNKKNGDTPEYKHLLEALSPYNLSSKRCKKLIAELKKPHPAYESITDILKSISINDFNGLIAYKSLAAAANDVFELYFVILNSKTDPQTKNKALRFLFDFIKTIVSEGKSALNSLLKPIDTAMGRLLTSKSEVRELFYGCSSYARAIIALSIEADFNELKNFISFARLAFEQNFNFWLSLKNLRKVLENINQGALKLKLNKTEKKALMQLFKPVLHDELKRQLNTLNSAHSQQALINTLLSSSSYAQIVDFYRSALEQIEKNAALGEQRHLIKIKLLLKILCESKLKKHYSAVLENLSRTIKPAFKKAKSQRTALTLQIFKALGLAIKIKTCIEPAFNCIKTLSKAAARQKKDPMLFELVIDNVIKLGLQYPSDLSPQTGYFHVQSIRLWLEIIKLNPKRAKKLLSALIINLTCIKTAIKDTDLFQHDISSFLNADILSVYNLFGQLIRVLPVFNNDIGANGALRELSAQADELYARQDLLVHYLRKQIHAESTGFLLLVLKNCFKFWQTGSKSLLKPYLPNEVFLSLSSKTACFKALHKPFKLIFSKENGLNRFLILKPNEIKELAKTNFINENDLKRALYLLRVYKLLQAKYSPNTDNLIVELKNAKAFDSAKIDKLEQCLKNRAYSSALKIALTFFEKLKKIICSKAPTKAVEHIAFKRHIAAGAKSMYGIYHEAKFDASRLKLKLEALINMLLEENAAKIKANLKNKNVILKISSCVKLFLRALKADRVDVKALLNGTELLFNAVKQDYCDALQYRDIFNEIRAGLKTTVEAYLSVHNDNLPLVIKKLYNAKALSGLKKISRNQNEFICAVSEGFNRSILSAALGLQTFDSFIAEISDVFQNRPRQICLFNAPTEQTPVYRPQYAISQIYEADKHIDNRFMLGNKGYLLKQTAKLGFLIPRGFILTTEVYKHLDKILADKKLYEALLEAIKCNISLIEEQTGKTFGKPDNPLLFSVRSGSAISMPGMLETFLNVGLNPQITEGLCAKINNKKAPWACYCAFLRMWGMSFGLSRSVFDNIANNLKARFKTNSLLNGEERQLKELAFHYRKALSENGIAICDNPFEQLKHTVMQIFRSWNSNKAKLFRRQMNISNNWGTAVTVQEMVFGNLSKSSGSGVVFTKDPKSLGSKLELFGDFSTEIQGEGIVSGLVKTCPISEKQRVKEALECEFSLESKFKNIYDELYKYAETLVIKHKRAHQEIEFTFEGEKASSLFILQTRDFIGSTNAFSARPAAKISPEQTILGRATGIGTGITAGRAVFNQNDINRIKKSASNAPLILIRADTVPEDISLIMQTNGLLSARGGYTSHSAVTLPRLGKVGVIGFFALKVFENESYCLIGSKKISLGDYLTLDAQTGLVYDGKAQPKGQLTQRERQG